jgi:palmitoyltransferase ZDHHC13/17
MIGLSLVLAVAFTVASCRDPGYVKKQLPFMDVLSKIHPCEMCPDCEIIRTPRSKHCAICNQCVDRFDHHCPWINNCVGVYNHNSFMVFIISLLLVLVTIVCSSVSMFTDECHPRHNEDDCPMLFLCFGCKNLPLRYTMLVLTCLITLFFGVPSSALFYVHVKNYCANKTTNERFSRKARSNSDASETMSSISEHMTDGGDETPQKKGACWNCARFCLNTKITSQERLRDLHLQEDEVNEQGGSDQNHSVNGDD